MNLKKLIITFILLLINCTGAYSQDFIRVGITHDFKEKKAIESFSLDFNMTNKEEGRLTKYLVFSGNGLYLLPSSSINLGDGISSSENNIMAQIKAGKGWYKEYFCDKGTYAFNQSIEINPSYNSDKNFQEKLAYGQLKAILCFIGTYPEHANGDTFTKKAFAVSLSPFANIGYRWSKANDLDKFYSTAGISFNFNNRYAVKIDKEVFDDLSFKINGSIYYIASESGYLTNDKFAGMIKAGVNKRIFRNAYAGLSYKYGNDNPTYTKLNVLELSLGVFY